MLKGEVSFLNWNSLQTFRQSLKFSVCKEQSKAGGLFSILYIYPGDLHILTYISGPKQQHFRE